MPAPRARANPSPRAPQPDPDEARPNREQGIAPRGQTGPREPSGRRAAPRAGQRCRADERARRRTGRLRADAINRPTGQRRRGARGSSRTGSPGSGADLPRALPDRDRQRGGRRDRRHRGRLCLHRLDVRGLYLRQPVQPVAHPARDPGLEHASRVLRGGHGQQPPRHAAAEVPALPAGVRQPLQPARHARADPAAAVQAGRQGRPVQLGPQPRARRPGRPVPQRLAGSGGGRPAGLPRFHLGLPAEPDLQAGRGPALAGDRPVRRHAASLCRPGLGSCLLPRHLGSSARQPVLPHGIRAGRRGRRVAPGASVPAASGSAPAASDSAAPSDVPSAGSSTGAPAPSASPEPSAAPS